MYPQPSAEDYVRDGFRQFRLATPLVSPGDIYQSEVGGHAMCIGPDSDISRVNVVYFDDQLGPTFVNQLQISPQRAFIGRMDARNEVAYQPANRDGRILLYSADLFDPNYRPPSFNPSTDTLAFESPNLEVIQYFDPPPSLTPQRNDREFYFQSAPAAIQGGGTMWIGVPYYGRSFASVEVANYTSVNITAFTIWGVNFAITDPAVYLHQNFLLSTAAIISPTVFYKKNIERNVDGTFDYLFIGAAFPAPSLPLDRLSIIVRMSDTP